LNVGIGVLCEESDVLRGGLTVDGTYRGKNIEIVSTGSGVGISNAGVVELSGGSISTTGLGHYGLDIRNTPGTFSGSNLSITTTGEQADAITLAGNNIFVELDNVRLTTHQDFASGIEAADGAIVEGRNVSIETHGTVYSDGVTVSDAGSRVSLHSSSIITHGGAAGTVGSHGVAMFAGVFDGTDLTISTHGIQANSLDIYRDGEIALADSAVLASGINGAAIGILSDIGGTNAKVSVLRGSLSSAQGALIYVAGGEGEISLIGPMGISAGIVGGRRVLAHVTNFGVRTANIALTLRDITTAVGDIDVTGGQGNHLDATFLNSTWVGDLRVDVGDTANVTLRGSRWRGWAQNANDILLNPSIWTVTGNSNAVSVNNAGLITFDPAAGGFPSLTTDNYVGNSARLGLNTQLDGDGSPSNLLIINGGAATGTTGIIITNAGGMGAQTVSDGILVVDASTNGGATDPTAFTLASRAAAGAYEYLLHRGDLAGVNTDDWFLRSHVVQAGAPNAPLYRPEVPLYQPIPDLGRDMGLAYLGTLHERMGEQANILSAADKDGYAKGAWARLIGETGHASWEGAFGVRADDSRLAGIQAGVDIIRHEDEDGDRDHLGLYAGFAHQSSRISGHALHQNDLRVGRLDLSGPALGAYWTHYNANGGYLDGVLQWHGFSVAGISDYAARLNTTGHGFTASLEAGQPFALDDKWQIEPQAQLIYQSLSVATGKDDFSPVSFAASNALTGRLGLRMQFTEEDEDTLFQPYVKANLWHGFGGTDTTSFNAKSFENHFGGTALDLGVGFTTKMNETTSFHGYVDHRWSIGGRETGAATQAALGLRVKW
jgi:outer membrane autotransporter protein